MDMAENLFLTEKHPVSGRYATFEDDGTSAWLYLTERDSRKVIADAWVYNCIAPPRPEQVHSFRPSPPPAALGFVSETALCSFPKRYDWALLWSEDGESVAVTRDVLRQCDSQIGPGESTAVVVDVQADRICGASVGDSQAWVIKDNTIADLTAHQQRKPLLGSGEADPVGFLHGRLDGLLIAASDGFCNYVKRTEMVRIIPFEDFAILPKRLVSLVRLRSGALNDDVGIVVCRYQRPTVNQNRVYSLDIEDSP
jgi:hypothetical protein